MRKATAKDMSERIKKKAWFGKMNFHGTNSG